MFLHGDVALLWCSLFRIEPEEIISEDAADAQEHPRVNGTLLVDFIEVGAVTPQLPCKPDRSLSLRLYLLPNLLSDMYHRQ